MAEAFLNYASRDRAAASAISDRLQLEGIRTPEPNLVPGIDFASAVERAIETADCVIVLWSIAASQSEFAALELKHAIKAWTEDRLVLVTLDDTPLPVGLRDQKAIEFDGRERQALGEVADAVLDRVRAREDAHPSARPPKAPTMARVDGHAPLKAAARGSGWAFTVLGFLLVTIPLVLWLAPRTQDQIFWSDDLMSRLLEMLQPVAWAIVALCAAIAIFVLYRATRQHSKIQPALPAPGTPAIRPAETVARRRDIFISYSWKDSSVVERLVSRIEGAGYGVWIDRSSRDGASARYAGPIVGAIRSSRVVAVMCSNNAFGSDHVVREVYVAGDFKKPFLRVDLDGADVPDELLYFLTGFPKLAPAELEGSDFKNIMQRFVA